MTGSVALRPSRKRRQLQVAHTNERRKRQLRAYDSPDTRHAPVAHGRIARSRRREIKLCAESWHYECSQYVVPGRALHHMYSTTACTTLIMRAVACSSPHAASEPGQGHDNYVMQPGLNTLAVAARLRGLQFDIQLSRLFILVFVARPFPELLLTYLPEACACPSPVCASPCG